MMCPSFWISSLTVSGHPTRRDSTLTFSPGLNVIYGPSDTGKSWILQCIDYMFGKAAQSFVLTANSGYDQISMNVETPRGRITLRRPIGERQNDIEVTSNDQRIVSGTYKRDTKSNRYLPISHVWLKLIGFEDPDAMQVIRNQDMQGASLTWRTFLPAIFADETSIDRSRSILLPEQATAVTQFKSALAMLITGKDFTAEIRDEPMKTKERKNNAIIEYLERQPQTIRDRIRLIDQTLGDDDENLENHVDELVVESDRVKQALREAASQGRQVVLKLQSVQESIAESEMLRQRYLELVSSYQARLERLDFVNEGRKLTAQYPIPMICPTCDQAIPAAVQSAVAPTGRREHALLEAKLRDLKTTLHELDAERQKKIDEEQRLRRCSDDITSRIDTELSPRFNKLKDAIENHDAAVSMRVERKQLIDRLRDVEEELERRRASVFVRDKFNILDYYPKDFCKDMGDLLLNTLGACAFPNLRKAEFGGLSFDAVINGKMKSEEGKGYRSFINTAVMLAMHDYLASSHSRHALPILMIDTPLLGLDDPQPDPELNVMRETVPKALYEYLAARNDIGQTFIVDNDKFMPDVSEVAEQCHIIRFTKRKDEGPGFNL
ncbi:ATP-binding protein [Bifidobacterium margollesii]|nr:ATP-binding protein [Bifidobacterium margollesii]